MSDLVRNPSDSFSCDRAHTFGTFFSGDEELERWIKMFKAIADRKQSFKDNRRSKSRGGGGGKQRWGKRPSKVTFLARLYKVQVELL